MDFKGDTKEIIEGIMQLLSVRDDEIKIEVLESFNESKILDLFIIFNKTPQAIKKYK